MIALAIRLELVLLGLFIVSGTARADYVGSKYCV